MATRTAAQSIALDKARLQFVIVELLGVDPASYAQNETHLALDAAGITRWNDHFVGISEGDIDTLVVPAVGPDREHPLSLAERRKLKQVLSFYHHACRNAKPNGKRINITRCNKIMFDAYRTEIYDPSASIVPWGLPIASEDSTQLESWRKNIKPNTKDFIQLKDSTGWQKWKEQTKTTLESQGLAHLVDESYVVSNKLLDDTQMKWLYKVFFDILKDPSAVTVVHAFQDTKDTRGLWKSLCKAYDNSMSAQLKAQLISTYITSTRLDKSNWRGKQSEYILHYKEQTRRFNEIATGTNRYSDSQLVTFLQAAVAGTPNLSNVLTTYRTAARSAGHTREITFDEYVLELTEQAAVHDAGNTFRSNPRQRQSVNVTEIVFDDCTEAVDVTSLEADTHESNMNMYTPIEVLMTDTGRAPINNSGTGNSMRVRLNKATWDSLSSEDQTAWDTLSDKGKQTIKTYALKLGQPNLRTRNGRFGNQRRTAQGHESDPQEPEDSKDEDDSSKIEASTHEREVKFASTGTPQKTLLHMATHQTKSLDGGSANIANLLSQASKVEPKGCEREGHVHEFLQRSDDTPYDDDDGYESECESDYKSKPGYEVNAHRIDFSVFDSSSDEEEEMPAIPGMRSNQTNPPASRTETHLVVHRAREELTTTELPSSPPRSRLADYADLPSDDDADVMASLQGATHVGIPRVETPVSASAPQASEWDSLQEQLSAFLISDKEELNVVLQPGKFGSARKKTVRFTKDTKQPPDLSDPGFQDAADHEEQLVRSAGTMAPIDDDDDDGSVPPLEDDSDDDDDVPPLSPSIGPEFVRPWVPPTPRMADQYVGVPFGLMNFSNDDWKKVGRIYGTESYRRATTAHQDAARASEHVATPQEHVADPGDDGEESEGYDSDDESIPDQVYKSLGLEIPTKKPPPLVEPHDFSESDTEGGATNTDQQSGTTIPGSDGLGHEPTTPRMMSPPFQEVPVPTPFKTRIVPDVESNKYVVKSDQQQMASVPLTGTPDGPRVATFPRQRPNRTLKGVRKPAPHKPPPTPRHAKKPAGTPAKGFCNTISDMISPTSYGTARVQTSSSSSDGSPPHHASQGWKKAKGKRKASGKPKTPLANRFSPLAEQREDSSDESVSTSSGKPSSQGSDFQEGGTK